MAKFTINADVPVPLKKTVEAVKYRHGDGYFHFFGAGETLVYSVMASNVVTIEREVDSK